MSGAIATLKAVLGLDALPYRREMDAATARARGFERDFKSMAGTLKGALSAVGVGFSVAGIASSIRAVMAWGDELSQAAGRLGATTAQMVALNRVALQNGVTTEKLVEFLSKLQNATLDAASGNERLRKSFKELGLDADRVVQLPMADQMLVISRAVVSSGRALTGLSDIVGDRLGPAFANLAKAIAESGIGQIAEESSAATDAVAVLSNKVNELADRLKEAGAVFGLEIVKGAETALAFIRGVADEQRRRGAEDVESFKNNVGVIGRASPDDLKKMVNSAMLGEMPDGVSRPDKQKRKSSILAGLDAVDALRQKREQEASSRADEKSRAAKEIAQANAAQAERRRIEKEEIEEEKAMVKAKERARVAQERRARESERAADVARREDEAHIWALRDERDRVRKELAPDDDKSPLAKAREAFDRIRPTSGLEAIGGFIAGGRAMDMRERALDSIDRETKVQTKYLNALERRIEQLTATISGGL